MGYYYKRNTRAKRKQIISALVKPCVEVISTKFLTTKEKELLEQINKDYGNTRMFNRYRIIF
jgi:hypothetical protein